jgi:hypothetical protein
MHFMGKSNGHNIARHDDLLRDIVLSFQRGREGNDNTAAFSSSSSRHESVVGSNMLKGAHVIISGYSDIL